MNDETQPEQKTTFDHSLGAFLVAMKAQAVCEFVAILLSDPDGLPDTPEGMQRSAEVILEEMGADFPTQYQETLDGGPLAAQERYMARLRPNREGSIPA